MDRYKWKDDCKVYSVDSKGEVCLLDCDSKKQACEYCQRLNELEAKSNKLRGLGLN